MTRRRLGLARGDRGSVLLETAMAVPVLMAITVALVWVVSLGAVYVRTLDAAQTAARLVARGLPADNAQRLVADGTLTIIRESDTVRAVVTRRVTAPVPLLEGLGFDVRAEAVALAETLS